MNTAYFLINTIFDIYLMVVLLRVWLQWARADFYNPMSQMVVKVTNPLVIPLRRVIPGFGGVDMASVLLAIIIAFAKLALLKSMNVLLADWLTISLFAALTVLKKAGSMIFWVLLIRAILSWVSQGRNPIEHVIVLREGDELILHLMIQPKASRDQIVGLHGDELKVAITAPPVDGQANSHLIKYLAKQFKVAKGQVRIVRGELGRHKTVAIESPRQIPAEIHALLETQG